MQLCRPKRRCTLARLGAIDLRAQTQIPSVLRTDTPRSMCPKQIGGRTLRTEVCQTEASRHSISLTHPACSREGEVPGTWYQVTREEVTANRSSASLPWCRR